MPKVKIQMEGWRQMGATLHLRLRSPGQKMKKLLEPLAEFERETHAYQNRTGDLEASTRAVQVNQHTAALEMGMPYASYVVDKGLSQLPELAERGEEVIRVYFGAPLKD